MAYPWTFSAIKLASTGATFNSAESRHLQGDELSLDGVLERCADIRKGVLGKTVIDVILLD